jgi:hypothetical protein
VIILLLYLYYIYHIGREDPDQLPDVIVMIGERLRFNVGKLDYNELDPALTKPVIIAVGVGVALLIIIVIIVLIAYRRKSTESTRVLKNMQVRLQPVLRIRIHRIHMFLFGPPGSGSTFQRYESGSGSGSGSFHHHAKIVRKTLIPTIL